MSSAKKNNATLGIFWIALGMILILNTIVITVNSVGKPQLTQMEMPAHDNVLTNRMSSPKVVIEPQLIISQEDLSFKLSDEYLTAYEMFKSKTITSDNTKNSKQQFKDFLQLYGININADGILVDVGGTTVPPRLIECQVMGYFPGKPYIKTNCA